MDKAGEGENFEIRRPILNFEITDSGEQPAIINPPIILIKSFTSVQLCENPVQLYVTNWTV
jgi:hypothetical protein